MKNIITLLLCLITISVYAQADEGVPNQTDAHIFGHVLDKKTQEHLPFVTIRIKGTMIAITTDATGHYFLRNLPTGNFTMEISMMGYKTITKEVSIRANTSLEIDFEMEEESIPLNAVVVSANRNETNRMLAPSLVSVVDVKMLEATNSKNLAQALNFQPGLRVEDNCQNCGLSQVRINGLEGAYSQILINSRPIYGALTGVYGLEQIPSNMIDRIEVIRGGGSALFGSSAIGGVINVITKESSRNSGDVTHTFSSINGKASENNTMFNASLINDTRNAGIMVYGQHRKREGFDMDKDGFTELPMLINRALGFRSFLKTGLYSKLSIEYHNMHEFRRGGDSLKQQPFQSKITEQLEHYINGGGINYVQNSADMKNRFNLYASAQHTLRKSYYGGGDPVEVIPGPNQDQEVIDNLNNRLGSFGRSTELIHHLGGQYTRMIDKFLFMPAELTAGAEYLNNTLTDISGYRTRDVDQKTHTTSGFLQNEWKDDRWSILLGGRLDKHSLVKSAIFSPRANIRYNPNGKVNFRLSYSEGFRAPQYFDEDLHVDIAGGEHIVRVLSEDLQEERSRSVSGSIDFYHTVGSLQLNALAEGFFTHLKNKITAIDDPNVEGQKLVVNAKGENAKVYGINLEGRMAYGRLLDLQLGVTFQKSLFDQAQEPIEGVGGYREFMRTPDTYGYFVATWKPATRFSATLSGNYTRRMYVPHVKGEGDPAKDRFASENKIERVNSFFELHTKLSYDIPVLGYSTLQLNAGVQNIFNAYQKDFDTGAGRASDYIYGPGSPRSFFAGLKMTL
ncbi:MULTISPECIES: TonB-dependent receptor [Proteiniphilum]|jgi:outer membrane receptor for ferrienterochelin and colicins|uniref:TonB-dependent receptor n=5 Tax=Dysgonomonadaceae TaxID=2005520 RepID=UPI001EEABB16|nr:MULTISPECIES: TonB-dependent receptor [Proteiniphilum]ULB34910.1 TonB-dependent receptor [Proteiniphilum propionicum]